ncbi:hypothetical protein, partial [Nocardia cyriacigeorgica]|uniref:hypothetical protein n=1 Tax=Nocardia cyriacigeorgica TaxID=135487 RepID=UPI002455D406
ISRSVEPLVHTLAALIDNALRYSPPTSYVDVSFQEGHHGVTVPCPAVPGFWAPQPDPDPPPLRGGAVLVSRAEIAMCARR